MQGDCLKVAIVTTRSAPGRFVGLAGITLVALLLISGCAPEEDQPESSTSATPIPTAAALAPPASEGEAVAGATEALQNYTATVNLIFEEGGVNPERIDAFALDVVRDQLVADARQVAELGYQFDGDIVATVESGYAGEREVEGETLEFGSVNLIFCNDSRNRSVVLADGSVPPLPADRAPRFDAGMSFDPVKMSWFVRSLTPVGTSCA